MKTITMLTAIGIATAGSMSLYADHHGAKTEAAAATVKLTVVNVTGGG